MFANPSVGFSQLPSLLQRKAVQKGIHFNLMVVGEAGLGKSTMINSLFMTDMYPERSEMSLSNSLKTKTMVAIEPTTVEIEEDGVKVKLTIIDTPGFGDSLDDTQSTRTIIQYIDEQFEKYYQGENSIHRKYLADTRVHACLYFISPFGHGLKPIDLDFLSKVHMKVNLIPVIAKADALTNYELEKFRSNLLSDFSKYKIKLYEAGEESNITKETADRDPGNTDSRGLIGSLQIPFAVSGANTGVSAAGGDKVRGLLYPWGLLDVENPKFSDLPILRQFLIHNMQDMREETHEGLYEAFRLEKMVQHDEEGSIEN